jgi:putative flippase GtrA
MLRVIRAHSAARFVLVGLTNFVVSFAVFYLSFRYLPAILPRNAPVGAIATLAAYLAGMVNSFVLNRSWTFRAAGNASAQALRFTIVNLSSLTLSVVVMYLFVDVLGHPELAVWLPTTAIVMTLNYLGCRHWAFASESLPSGKAT